MVRIPLSAIVVVLLVGFAGTGFAQAKRGKITQAAARVPEGVLVVVNGQNITQADLEQSLRTRKVPAEMRASMQGKFLQELVDSRLIAGFLAERKIVADRKELDEQIKRLKELAKNRGKGSTRVLSELGYTDEALRKEFELPLAWKQYVDQAISAKSLQRFWSAHQQEFDGTRVRAKHVLIKVAGNDEAEWKAAERKLAALREKIVADEMTFEDAAAEYSDAPSKEDGGEVGWFPWVGRMPVAFSEVAFAMKPGEISPPFRTKYGVHLCLLVARKAGAAQLEDMREEVKARASQELWKQSAAELRQTATIEWHVEEPE